MVCFYNPVKITQNIRQLCRFVLKTKENSAIFPRGIVIYGRASQPFSEPFDLRVMVWRLIAALKEHLFRKMLLASRDKFI
jgi:hypothetical protein